MSKHPALNTQKLKLFLVISHREVFQPEQSKSLSNTIRMHKRKRVDLSAKNFLALRVKISVFLFWNSSVVVTERKEKDLKIQRLNTSRSRVVFKQFIDVLAYNGI